MVPQPGTLNEIADLLDIDVIVVFRAAGYMRTVDEKPFDPRDADIKRLKVKLELIMRRVPAQLWGVSLGTAEVTLDQLGTVLSRIEEFLANFGGPPSG